MVQGVKRVTIGKLSFHGQRATGISATFESARPRIEVEAGTIVYYSYNGTFCEIGTVDEAVDSGRSVDWTFSPIYAATDYCQHFIKTAFIKGGGMGFLIGEYECQLVGDAVKLITKAVVSINPMIITGTVPATITLRNPLKVHVDVRNINVDVYFGNTHIATVKKPGVVFDVMPGELSPKVLPVSLNVAKVLHLVRTLGRKTIRIVINHMDVGIGHHVFPVNNVTEDDVDFEAKVMGLLNIAGIFGS